MVYFSKEAIALFRKCSHLENVKENNYKDMGVAPFPPSTATAGSRPGIRIGPIDDEVEGDGLEVESP